MESLSKFGEFTKHYRRTRIMKKTVLGILAVTAGILLLAFNFDLINQSWRHIIFSWQMLLIAIGLINIFDRDSVLTGIILLIIGSVFLMPELFIVPFKLHQVFWPVILVLAGTGVILKHRFGFFGKKYGRHFNHRFQYDTNSNDLSESGYINQTNIFGGSKKMFDNSVFRGGKITNIFGGGELDFRNTQLAEGRNILEITSIFGGMNIIVPHDWIVNIEVDNVLGAFQDKRIIRPDKNNLDEGRELVIKGIAVFGGGDLKSI